MSKLTFDRTSKQSPDKISSEQNIDDQRRQCRQNRSCHLYIPVDNLTTGQILQCHHDRLLALRRQCDRKQELIPDVRKLPDADDDKARH